MNGSEIAIIGMSCRFPGSRTPEEFWKNLISGVEGISVLSDQELEEAGVKEALRENSKYVRRSAVLGDIDQFDADFWGINRREAELMDPQHRIFLECAWETIERAGYDASRYPHRIGVYAGTSPSTYFVFNVLPHFINTDPVGAFQALLLNDKDYLCTRASYKMNLRGPSVTVQTACSTSLVAVHFACQSLLNGESDMALAGGATIRVPEKEGYLYQEGGVLSPDGLCRAFDAEARGTASGAGVGVVLLKRLEDAIRDRDPIIAVIRGTAINNDGSDKIGYTAPSINGQADVIQEALAIAEVEPDSLGLMEAHGTGTPLGDPIEIAALTQAYRASTEKKSFCAIGSLKTNLGHMDAAAGVGGLMKAALSLQSRQIPASLHFTTPNPQIDFPNSPFYVNTELRPWEATGPRRAGVSSFGIGGTNAHVVLEEAPLPVATSESRKAQLLLLSARTESALRAAGMNLANHLQENPSLSLADVAHTLQVGRQRFPYRAIVVCETRDQAQLSLSMTDPKNIFTLRNEESSVLVTFLFPGQGAQYEGMARELYENELIFRTALDECAEILRTHLDRDIRDLLFPQSSETAKGSRLLDQTEYTQPALFSIQWALARLWQSWGIKPSAMIGHSLGEFVAATLAGVMCLKDALALVAFRGKLIQSLPAGGAMLSVSLSPSELLPHLSEGLNLAAVNAPGMCVVSGPLSCLEKMESALTDRRIPTRRLRTSHAFHSQLMDPILESFRGRVSKISLSQPTIPYVSNLTGDWITNDQATDPEYYVRHLRETVQFAGGLETLLKKTGGVFLEVGPGRTLSTFLSKYLKTEAPARVFPSLRHPQEPEGDLTFVQRTLGWLWLAGVDVDWSGYYANEKRRRVVLPTYPFERKSYWIAASYSSTNRPSRPNLLKETSSEIIPSSNAVAPSEMEEKIMATWKEFIGLEQLSAQDDFFLVGGDSLVASRIVARLKEFFPIELQVRHLLESQTSAGLALKIEELLIEKLESMTDEEAEALLAKDQG